MNDNFPYFLLPKALLLHYVRHEVYDIYEAKKGKSADTYEAKVVDLSL